MGDQVGMHEDTWGTFIPRSPEMMPFQRVGVYPVDEKATCFEAAEFQSILNDFLQDEILAADLLTSSPAQEHKEGEAQGDFSPAVVSHTSSAHKDETTAYRACAASNDPVPISNIIPPLQPPQPPQQQPQFPPPNDTVPISNITCPPQLQPRPLLVASPPSKCQQYFGFDLLSCTKFASYNFPLPPPGENETERTIVIQCKPEIVASSDGRPGKASKPPRAWKIQTTQKFNVSESFKPSQPKRRQRRTSTTAPQSTNETKTSDRKSPKLSVADNIAELSFVPKPLRLRVYRYRFDMTVISTFAPPTSDTTTSSDTFYSILTGSFSHITHNVHKMFKLLLPYHFKPGQEVSEEQLLQLLQCLRGLNVVTGDRESAFTKFPFIGLGQSAWPSEEVPHIVEFYLNSCNILAKFPVLDKVGCIHGAMSVDEATQLLQGWAEGTFLLRLGFDGLTLSYVDEETKECKHTLVLPEPSYLEMVLMQPSLKVAILASPNGPYVKMPFVHKDDILVLLAEMCPIRSGYSVLHKRPMGSGPNGASLLSRPSISTQEDEEEEEGDEARAMDCYLMTGSEDEEEVPVQTKPKQRGKRKRKPVASEEEEEKEEEEQEEATAMTFGNNSRPSKKKKEH